MAQDLRFSEPMESFEKTKQTALKSLAKRPRSVYEVRKKLEEAGVSAQTIEETIEYCLGLDYLNDARLARDWISWRLREKPAGKLLIRFELRIRGIDEATIEAALVQQYNDQNELLYAVTAARKKSQAYRTLERETAERRLRAFLSRRGFPYSIVGEAIDQIFAN